MGNDLALNVIVGPGESFELGRLLKSLAQPGVFDEIVIVNTSNDEAIDAVAREYTKKVYHFEWCNDFAAARNEALGHTTAQYVMWADADDVLPERHIERLGRMKEHILRGDFDVYLVPYHLEFDESGTAIQFLPRDRIFKRRRNLHWSRRVHEQLSVNPKTHSIARFDGICLEHRPTKQGDSGLQRNMRILAEEYEKSPGDPHTAFYYARDSFLVGEEERAIEIFDRILQERRANRDNLVVASVQCAMYYTYKGERALREDTIDRGETYARIALSFSEKYAEPYVILGDIYHYRGMVREATELYKIAMGRKLDGNGVQQVAFYEEVPADRLTTILLNEGEWAQALHYNGLVLKHEPRARRVLERGCKLLEQLSLDYGGQFVRANR